MKHKLFLISLILAGTSLFAENSVKFEFKHSKGDSNSYLSTVDEYVYVNNQLSHKAQIINRIASNVAGATPEGDGFIYATYLTTENSVGQNSGLLRYKEETTSSVFMRSKKGELTISDDIYMPTVRNVPVFPDKAVKPGDTWTADGKEVQDVRDVFNMKTALIFPFTATYKYTGDIQEEGKTLNVIEVNYTSSYKVPDSVIQNGCELKSSKVYSKQILYWDNQKGLLDHYNEEFSILLIDVQGNQFLFTGTGNAKVTEYKSVNNESSLRKIEDTIKGLKLKNISVKKGDKGLTISLENIQFEPDSPILLDSEKQKLNLLSEILNEYSNDLLITGHCAARGTVKERQELSEERAEAVAEYLINLGVRDRYHVFTQGKGSEEPIATNATEEGRAKNRRVEITIMD